jgi:predicted metal-dependent enzyme (double-stranded beta helix superfamily)
MNLSLDTDRDDWTRSLRLRIGTLPADPGPGDIENLLDRLTPVAWLAGCPDTRSLDLAHLPRRYRRHLVAGGSDDGYTALLIAWPPGYQSPVHDHAGLWGIELVLEGALAIEEFSRDGVAGEPALAHERTLILGIGDAASFTRPDYVHACRNLSSQQPALSLHVYGGVLDEYSAFHTSSRGRYTTTRQRAGIDAVMI